MALSLQQVQKQTQKLIMTPQMQQSIQLLQMTTMELEQLATQEMMENPFLELREDEEELAPDSSAAAADLGNESPAEVDTEPSSREADISEPADTAQDEKATEPSEIEEPGLIEAPDKSAPDDELYSYDASIEKYDEHPTEEPATFDTVDVDWSDTYSDAESPVYSPREDEEERDFTQYTASRESLYDSLERQLHLSALEGEGLRIGEFLIGNLNDDGLFDTSIPALLSLLEVPVELLSRDANADELRRAVATLLRKDPKDLDQLDPKQLYFQGMAALLEVPPPDLTGLSRADIEKALLAKRFDLPGEQVEPEDTRELFLRAVAQRLHVHRDQVEDALDVIQEFEPTGIGARDLAECLRLQAETREIRNPTLYRLIDEALPLLQQKKFRDIAHQFSIPEDEVVKIFHIVSKFEPRPARSITRESARYITPDVFVKKVDGHYLYYLNEGDTSRLRISARYRQLLRQAQFNGKNREYAQEKLRAASWLIRNIEKRKSTILRVTEAIMEYQREFLEKGLEHLRPLTLREIADVVGMHESTIARVTTGKYVETPRGTFELKFFFSSGLETEEGEGASSRSIKEMIAQMIQAEDARRPLSDQKIASQLKDKGIQIARRTVAKYREQMKILPAKLRRETP